MTDPERQIDLLNALLDAETRSLLARLGEAAPFVSWTAADQQTLIEDLIEEQGRLEAALADAYERGALGDSIFGTNFNFQVEVFVCEPPCACLADLNGDGQRNGADVQAMVDCFVATGTNCNCGDLDGNTTVEPADIAAFVITLLSAGACPP